ncbi:NUDIX hydrolase [Glycomyces sp. L485]|uniref:NUDIX domain-containing protein n=1 Tax=Glycomyces sp. L485 TaxID=2909235 RepID=UPI001F4A4AD9|nr:NUDIX hydrolase [Glycomyces sp. L485]MCH7231993.1 NUDIX hydrolase [Glycomyces sp. L485]
MKSVRLPAPVLRAASPAVRLWWRIRKPETFGVKALLIHPDGSGRFLAVRHSYADTRRWALPGGGFEPSRETPESAVSREICEELGLKVPSSRFVVLDTVVTTLEGKRDTLTILTATAATAVLSLSPELAEARWIGDLAELGDAPVSRWLLAALAHCS